MFRRLLAFVLAGCLVLDTASVTSYAAEQKTVMESSVETAVPGESDGEDRLDWPEEETAQQEENAQEEEPGASGTSDGEGLFEIPDGGFAAQAAQTPASISLSQEQIGLNIANTGGAAYEGYNQTTLKVKTEPGTAAADFIWVSSNPAVAAVKDGVVSAKGVGKAKITVKSAYDETVTASCDVTVKNYVIGYLPQMAGEPDLLYYDDEYGRGSVFKDEYVNRLYLYEQNAAGRLTQLSDYEGSVDRPEIARWDDVAGDFRAFAVGSTRIYFEKDGVKASCVLTVSAAGQAFGIIGFTTNKTDYPAVSEEQANSYILAYLPGITYSAIGEISPSGQAFNPSDFIWQSSDERVATVSQYGVVTPVKAGDVTLTIEPKTFDVLAGNPYAESVELALHIRKPPVHGTESIYALSNTASRIGDVPFPETWSEGWSWKYPDTPLVTNGVYKNTQYEFDAVYRDGKNGVESYYPYEVKKLVYIGRITGLSVVEQTAGISHNQVLEVSGETGTAGVLAADTLTLRVSPLYQGIVSEDTYVVEMPEISGLTVTKNSATGYYDITAQKAGNYTLKPVIKDKSTNKVLAQASYKIKAVAQKQAAGIVVSLDNTSIGDGVTMNAAGTIIFNSVEEMKDFTLKATVKDRNGQETDTVLQWKTSDKSVASIAAASKQDSHTAKVTVKGEGHTVLTATAKDAQGLSVSVKLEVRNHRPRVNTAKATVNIAYDYKSSVGASLARSAGSVEIVPVYGESIKSVSLCNEDGQVSTDLQVEKYDDNNWLIKPAAEEIKTGNYNCKLLVTTSAQEEYSYPLQISVVDKAPAVSVKMETGVNLFFTDSIGWIKLTIGDNQKVDSVIWRDQSEDVNNGFVLKSTIVENKNKYVSYIMVEQEEYLRVAGGKPENPDVAKGTLTVKVQGYRKIYTFENFNIKYTYKKPNIVTMSASSNVIPAAGQNRGWFRFYDKTNKRYLYSANTAREGSDYDELTWDSDDVKLEHSGNEVDYTYNGSTGTKKLTMTLNSRCWREPLKAVHTIKSIKPQIYLSSDQLIFNTAVKSSDSVRVMLKNTGYNIKYKNIVIEGANAASKRLIENELFIITASDNEITVSMSDAEILGMRIQAGSYKFKVTPYCENPGTGEQMALKTMTLKVKVVNKPITAKVSPKGVLELTYGASSVPTDKKNYVVLVDPKFSNMASGYSISYKLVGEYSSYFSLNRGYIKYANKYDTHYYISIANRTASRLKAGQTYKLAIEYTLEGTDGRSITVTSNTFNIKPKQANAKITVRNNNQTMYAGASLTRSYSLSVPSYYSVTSASGGIDCNKDGKADITVSGSGTSLTVRIVDADAVVASTSGKTYSIPVTVCLQGRDGVSKDASVTVKVKVKR